MIIRPETTDDAEAVWHINEQAFDSTNEPRLVAALRSLPGTISLVAETDGQPVGHILFSQGIVHDPQSGADHTVAILAPMAVLPDWQRQGVGSRLVTAGLQACREAGYQLVVVLGHPWYYPLFGFIPASRFAIRYPQTVRDEVFMAQELHSGAGATVQGVLQLPQPFELVE